MKDSKIDVTREYVQKYLDLAEKFKVQYSKSQIARTMQQERPDLFKDVEDARSYVRIATGANGEQLRRDIKGWEDLNSRFALMAGQVKEVNDTPFIIPKQYKNVLVIADLHSLFYDVVAVKAAIQYGLSRKCDACIILGDFMDSYQFSSFTRNPLTVVDFLEEREWGIDMLQVLQDCFGKVFLRKGNHDVRRERYHQKLSLQEDDYKSLINYEDYLMFDGSNVEVIGEAQLIKYGKLNMLHGDEIRGGGGIHVAYNRLRRTMDNIMSAHSHVCKSEVKPRLDGDVLGSWTIGCLCNLKPAYSPINDWTQGCARVERDEDGCFIVHNNHIRNGRVSPY